MSLRRPNLTSLTSGSISWRNMSARQPGAKPFWGATRSTPPHLARHVVVVTIVSHHLPDDDPELRDRARSFLIAARLLRLLSRFL
jgi:hypothetical protein